MHHFHYAGQKLHCESVDLAAIAQLIVDEAVPPVAMAGCSARMLDAAVAALDAKDAAAAATAVTSS